MSDTPNNNEEAYNEDDSIIIGGDGPPIEGIVATAHNCHRCNAVVNVSIATMNDALDNVAKHPGRKIWIVCMDCIRPEEVMNNPNEIGAEQRAEMLANGVDIDEMLKRTGKTYPELMWMALKKARLQRAAKKAGADMMSSGIKIIPDLPGVEQCEWSKRLMGIREIIENMGKDLDPDEDWMPMLCVDGILPADFPGIPGADVVPADVPKEHIGKRGITMMGFMGGAFMENDEQKDKLAKIMMMTAVRFQAYSMVWVSTTWFSSMNPTPADENPNETEEELMIRLRKEAEAHGKPADDPNRKEKILMLSVSHDGEDDGVKIAFADIQRHEGKPPTLHNWTITDPGPHGNFFGRFPDAIHMGLMIAAEMRRKGITPDKLLEEFLREMGGNNEGEEWKKAE